MSASLAAVPCAAEEVPFAAPPPTPPGHSLSPPAGLADIMGKTQLRHIKLWFAIKSRNWDLMNYELGHLRDSFETAVILYQNIPVDYIIGADKPLVALQAAIKAKASTKLEPLYAELTAACNACHEAANIAYIKIETPTSWPFSNQRYAPKKK
jgi:hypothetical protein